MKAIFILITCVSFFSCRVHEKENDRYSEYYTKESVDLFFRALDFHKAGDYATAYPMLSDLINSNNKFNSSMPKDINPYYFRGTAGIRLGEFQTALKDFDHVAPDTTTDTEIILARAEILRMLRNYDSSIVLCNRLLELRFDSAVALSERGMCYHRVGKIKEGCRDLLMAKEMRNGVGAEFMDDYLKDCK